MDLIRKKFNKKNTLPEPVSRYANNRTFFFC